MGRIGTILTTDMDTTTHTGILGITTAGTITLGVTVIMHMAMDILIMVVTMDTITMGTIITVMDMVTDGTVEIMPTIKQNITMETADREDQTQPMQVQVLVELQLQ